MADSNHKKPTFPVTAMEARRYTGGSVRVGSGGSWQADESLNQIAVLLSQITFNQRALWRNIETMPQNIQNLSDDIVTGVNNQVAIDYKLKKYLSNLDQNLVFEVNNQRKIEQHNIARFQEVNQNLSRLNQQMAVLTKNLETLTQAVQTLAGTAQTMMPETEPAEEKTEEEQ